MVSFQHGKLYEDTGRTRIFTDGSKKARGEAGLGVVLIDPENREVDLSIVLGTNSTVVQAEALAISQTCALYEQALAAGTKLPAAITIYSDSQSVLRALHSRWVKSTVDAACIESLNSIGEWASV